MNQEGPLLDKQSLRSVTGKTADWRELCEDRVAFANASAAVERQNPRLANGPDDGLWNSKRKFSTGFQFRKYSSTCFNFQNPGEEQSLLSGVRSNGSPFRFTRATVAQMTEAIRIC